MKILTITAQEGVQVYQENCLQLTPDLQELFQHF